MPAALLQNQELQQLIDLRPEHPLLTENFPRGLEPDLRAVEEAMGLADRIDRPAGEATAAQGDA